MALPSGALAISRSASSNRPGSVSEISGDTPAQNHSRPLTRGAAGVSAPVPADLAVAGALGACGAAGAIWTVIRWRDELVLGTVTRLN